MNCKWQPEDFTSRDGPDSGIILCRLILDPRIPGTHARYRSGCVARIARMAKDLQILFVTQGTFGPEISDTALVNPERENQSIKYLYTSSP